MMENNQKSERHIVMLMGEAGAGKTTYLKNNAEKFAGYTIISRDILVGEICAAKEKETGKHYSMDDVYNSVDKEVLSQRTREKLFVAINNGDNIVVESTNLNSKALYKIASGAEKSDNFDYKTKIIIINSPEEKKHINRLFKRSIKEKRFSSMNHVSLRGLEQSNPIKEGEFDHVEYVGKVPEKPLFGEYKKSVSLVSAIKDAENLGNGKLQR